jgi:ABC-2 type transport system ATP-binding protein
VVSASAAVSDDGNGTSARQTVAINLVLAEDGALGGVVTTLTQRGAHILALQKSEPTLEDVFVELVGRGFGEATPETGTPEAASV